MNLVEKVKRIPRHYRNGKAVAQGLLADFVNAFRQAHDGAREYAEQLRILHANELDLRYPPVKEIYVSSGRLFSMGAAKAGASGSFAKRFHPGAEYLRNVGALYVPEDQEIVLQGEFRKPGFSVSYLSHELGHHFVKTQLPWMQTAILTSEAHAQVRSYTAKTRQVFSENDLDKTRLANLSLLCDEGIATFVQIQTLKRIQPKIGEVEERKAIDQAKKYLSQEDPFRMNLSFYQIGYCSLAQLSQQYGSPGAFLNRKTLPSLDGMLDAARLFVRNK